MVVYSILLVDLSPTFYCLPKPLLVYGSMLLLSTLIVQSDIRAFDITGDWETMAVKAEVWVEAVTEEDAARHRQEKREATRLGKLQSHTEA